MTSPCLSGRAYALELEIMKSPSTSRASHTSSSPSSTISESSNSPLAISTRKPRTPRKRPNQIYNEAAAILSTAYPNIFSSKNLTNPRKFTKHHQDSLLLNESDSSDLLWPFRAFDDESGFVLNPNTDSEKSSLLNESKISSFITSDKYSSCQSDNSMGNSMEFCDGYEDFDAESILDEEIEEGIDSIMGNLSVSSNKFEVYDKNISNSWYGNPMGFHFTGKFQIPFNNGIRKGITAFRQANEANYWNYPIVDMLQISPRLSGNSNSNSNNNTTGNCFNSGKKIGSVGNFNVKVKKLSSRDKKKKKIVKTSSIAELNNVEMVKENLIPESNSGLLLKLNYDGILNAWSDRGSPFSEEFSGSEGGSDVSARLAQIDLFSENGGVREACVLRYKEKRRTRLFSKKIRYQVRKVNADQRPRMKGRFVRRPNSSSSNQRREK